MTSDVVHVERSYWGCGGFAKLGYPKAEWLQTDAQRVFPLPITAHPDMCMIDHLNIKTGHGFQ